MGHAEEQMGKSVEHTNGELAKIRAGKASPSMLDGLSVEYYGAATPLNQVASITAPDSRTIGIKPFEKKIIPDIERAIINSKLGVNPQNDGELIRINIPPLTEERRQSLVKQVKTEVENGKISVRNVRKEVMDSLKKLQKDGASEDEVKSAEEEVQKITDKHTKRLDGIMAAKEKDIMTI